MIDGRKVIVVLPAFQAEKTLERTVAEIPRNVADEILLVDDASQDHTVELARRLGIDARFVGYAADGDLPGYYRRARVTILPSRNRQEAWRASARRRPR